MGKEFGLSEAELKEALKQVFDADDMSLMIPPHSSGAKLISIVIGFLEAFDGEFEAIQDNTRFLMRLTKEEL